jgi:hypothetical protein
MEYLEEQLIMEVVHGSNPCSHYKLLHFVKNTLSKSFHLCEVSPQLPIALSTLQDLFPELEGQQPVAVVGRAVAAPRDHGFYSQATKWRPAWNCCPPRPTIKDRQPPCP